MRMLTNEPIGEDWYDGQAQTTLAQRIAAEIKNPSSFVGPENKGWEHTVVMALEGPWGCGKTNVIKMVENKVGYSIGPNNKPKGEAIFVNYDLWTHRQDLSRKSILESVVSELVDNKEILPQGIKEKLLQLTSERIHGYVRETPRLSWPSWIVGVLYAVLVGFEVWKSTQMNLFDWGLTSFQIIVCLVLIGLCRFVESEYKKYKDSSYESFRHVEEPSVTDFIKYLHEVDAVLKGHNASEGAKHVILVFDNLDRLGDAEIREFWAATHVLFAERRTHRPNNIQVIIPYDRARMRKAFGSPQAGDEYIRKVVDKVFVMPAVIMTDWSKFLSARIREAFDLVDDNTTSEAVRMFDWLHHPDDLTPRAMISFVNDMVSVCEGLRYDKNDKAIFPIPLSIVALYVLGWRRSPLAEKIDNTELLIVDGAFIPDECKIARMWYLGDIHHSTQLAAVVYQLPEKHAAAILTYQRVEAALDGNMSLGGICGQPDFHQVFSSVIKHVKQFEMVPQALSTIDTPDAPKYWDEYYDTKKDEIVMAHGSLPIISKGEALMFANITKWQDYFMRLEAHLKKDKASLYNELLQVQFVTSVEKALKSSGRTLVNHFERPPLPVAEYLKLLNAAKEHFPLMNATCDYNDLDAYVAKEFGRDKQCYGLRYLSQRILDKLQLTRAVLSAVVKDHKWSGEMLTMANVVYQRFPAL